jgi:hypothetical protein
VRRLRLGMVVLAAVAIVAAGCTNDGGNQTTGGSSAPQAAGDRLNLKGVCPDPVVIQSDWFPESEHGVLFQLVGPNPKVDAEKKSVSGPLVAEGKDTGVRIEVRSGGPATGNETVSAQMYKDKSITLGEVNTDEGIRLSASQPTMAVVAPMEISPLALVWDPGTYPQFNIIADVGQTDAKVLYFEGDTFIEYLVGTGILKRSQVDPSFDGSPAKFVASGGKAVVAGFSTSEPYVYEHEIPEWGKPVKYALINDTGYPLYPEPLAIRPADKDKLAPCLQKLVPIIQRAQIDFIQHPDETNALIIDVVKKYNTFWTFSPGVAKYAVETMRRDHINNGTDRTLGNFDMKRVQRMMDITTPIFTAQRQKLKADLKPEDLATNEFIDTSIGLK